uniref:Uncharacterized protein n=1 Tax=Knipowitschia caucasica TaxID=637954 RepID=A0AAV2JY81_KNICA
MLVHRLQKSHIGKNCTPNVEPGFTAVHPPLRYSLCVPRRPPGATVSSPSPLHSATVSSPPSSRQCPSALQCDSPYALQRGQCPLCPPVHMGPLCPPCDSVSAACDSVLSALQCDSVLSALPKGPLCPPCDSVPLCPATVSSPPSRSRASLFRPELERPLRPPARAFHSALLSSEVLSALQSSSSSPPSSARAVLSALQSSSVLSALQSSSVLSALQSSSVLSALQSSSGHLSALQS